jgi:hypothetical protein
MIVEGTRLALVIVEDNGGEEKIWQGAYRLFLPNPEPDLPE